MTGRWTGHVVVCGTDGVALRTVEQLRAVDVEVVVVDVSGRSDGTAARLLDSWGVPRVAGRPREALIEAGLGDAAAVVCMPDDDLHAMETALLARRIRPGVRLVVRMGNGAVGRALSEVAGEGSVLDVATLAAPSVVEACLGLRTHALELAGREFVVAELVAERTATLRELYDDLAPLIVTGTGPPVVCPGRDHPVREGDRVTAVGTPEQFEALGVAGLRRPPERAYATGARSAGAARAAQRAGSGGRAGLLALLRSLVGEADRSLRTAVALLGVLVAVSVGVLAVGYVKPTGAHMSFVDAVYFTVETIATVGYGDFSFAAQPTWLRVYAIGLMGFGAVLAAVVFALVTQLLVSRRLERSFGHRRVGALRGHVVVVGLGSVGLEVVARLLEAGRRVVVVERDEGARHVSRVRALGVPVVVGDATDTAVLATANLSAASAVAILTSDDLTNIETGLVVRDQLGERWDATPVVLRVFDRELATGVEDGFAFRHVRSTDALAAPWFVGAALGLDVLAGFSVDRSSFLVGRLSVAAGGGLDGLAMGELSERTRVVAIRRAGRGSDDGRSVFEHPLRRDTRFGAGDDAYLVGPYEELLKVLLRDAGSYPR